jgi:hypothetical protein
MYLVYRFKVHGWNNGLRETIIHSLLEIERRLEYLDIKFCFLVCTFFCSKIMSLCSH